MSLLACLPFAPAACAHFPPGTRIENLSAQIEALSAAILERDLPDARSLAVRSKCGVARGLVGHLAQMTASLEARRQRDEHGLFPLLRLGTPKCLDLASRRLTSDQVDIEERLLRLRQLAAGHSRDVGYACARLEAGLRRLLRLEAETLLAILEG